MKSLRRDLDIQSEMRPSSAPGVTDANVTKHDVGVNADLSEQETSLAEPRPTSDEGRLGEGSIRYRVAAMVAMLLLALVTLCIWYFGR